MLLQRCWQVLLIIFTEKWTITEPEYASMPPVFHLDDYDKCMFGNNTLYCSLSFELYPNNPKNTSEVWKIIQKIANQFHYRHDLLRHSICVSERCPHIPKKEILNNNPTYIAQLAQCYSEEFKNYDFSGEIVKILCETEQPLYSTNKYDRIFRLFLLTVICLVMFAWLYDVTFSPDLSNSTLFKKFISAFSVSQNWRKLVKFDLQNPDIRAMSCIQGMRTINAIVVIFSHCVSLNVSLPIMNTRYMERYVHTISYQYRSIGSRFIIIQSFFMTSSFLLTYKFCKDLEQKGKITLSYLFASLHERYLRLTPLMTIMILFYMTCIPHFSRGPLWELAIGNEYQICLESWWLNLLFINNQLPYPKTCMSHLWSMSVDMQFYVLALFLLWVLSKSFRKCVFLTVVIWIVHVIRTLGPGIAEKTYNIPESFFNATFVNMPKSINVVKGTTNNIPGVLFGIIYGCLFYKYRNKKVFTKTSHVALWWILSWVPIVASIVLPGFMINWLPRKQIWLILYTALSRTVFSFGMGLLIFGMTQGLGGFVRSIFEWRPFYILGRLSYAAYLVHPSVERLKAGVGRTPIYLNNYLLMCESVGHIACSFLLAVPLTLFFEMPFEEVRYQIFKSAKKQNKKLN